LNLLEAIQCFEPNTLVTTVTELLLRFGSVAPAIAVVVFTMSSPRNRGAGSE
jgi:hypothetical protein